MVKKNNDNEKYGGTGYEFRQMFSSPQPRHQTNTRLVVFDCLLDRDKELSDPIDRSPIRSGSSF